MSTPQPDVYDVYKIHPHAELYYRLGCPQNHAEAAAIAKKHGGTVYIHKNEEVVEVYINGQAYTLTAT